MYVHFNVHSVMQHVYMCYVTHKCIHAYIYYITHTLLKNGEIALWPSTNGSIPYILRLADSKGIFAELIECKFIKANTGFR